VEQSGIFITFEGGDGAGKSTQTKLLARWIEERTKREVVHTFEPGDTETGRAIRELLLHGSNLDGRTEALLFAADRAQHAAEVLRPALERGAVVICDRYIDSSVAYQSGGRALIASEITDLSLWATQNLVPDLTVLLDMDPRLSGHRIERVRDRMERESAEFHTAVRQSFLAQARAGESRYLIVDASGTVGEIHERITARVAQLLGVGP